MAVDKGHQGHPVILYGVPIHHAIAKGDLAEMKNLAAQAEEHLKQVGDVRSALEYLKIEIAKHSQKS